MTRVRDVLAPTGAVGDDCARDTLFRYVAEQMVRSGSPKTSPIVSVVHYVGNYWRHWLLMILRTGTYVPRRSVDFWLRWIPRDTSHSACSRAFVTCAAHDDQGRRGARPNQRLVQAAALAERRDAVAVPVGDEERGRLC